MWILSFLGRKGRIARRPVVIMKALLRSLLASPMILWLWVKQHQLACRRSIARNRATVSVPRLGRQQDRSQPE